VRSTNVRLDQTPGVHRVRSTNRQHKTRTVDQIGKIGDVLEMGGFNKGGKMARAQSLRENGRSWQMLKLREKGVLRVAEG
jgi:hypothetical protein